jgi:sortase A
MRKVVYLLVAAGIILGFSIGLVSAGKTKPTETHYKVVSPTQKVSETAVPVQINIPILSVSAKVEQVGIDKDGNMDIPKDFNNTAWYSPGPKPGETGSAVIDGHVDTPTGEPAVFAKISTLKNGDNIEVIDQNNVKHTFEVTKVADYDLATIPLEEIFSSKTRPGLNLITCAGTFDKSKKMYDKRTVVYSKLVN